MSEDDDIFGAGPDYANHPSHARPELLRRYADGIGEDLKRATFEGTKPVWWIGTAPNKLRHAADLIEALKARATAAEAERDKLRAALEPFAREAHKWDPPEGDDDDLPYGVSITIGDLRRARAARAPTEPSGITGRLPGEENADAQ